MLDVETELVAKLVDDGVLAGHVSSRLPADFESNLPYGTLRRAPGGRYIDENTRRLEFARLQLNTYGEHDGDVGAFTAMSSLVAALIAMEGTQVGALFITGVEIGQTADWAPDPDTSRPGYRSFVSIYVHP